MNEIIFVLGYELTDKLEMHPILIESLKEALKLYNENKERQIIVSGFKPYIHEDLSVPTEASLMSKWLIDHNVSEKNISKEETTQSSVEQLCWLKEQIEKEKISRVYIVCSEFFSNRIKLYSDHIFFNFDIPIEIISASVTKSIAKDFQLIEKEKYIKAKEWLLNIEYGDCKKMLSDMKEYKQKIKDKIIDYPFLNSKK
jgi:hypothetical protein